MPAATFGSASKPTSSTTIAWPRRKPLPTSPRRAPIPLGGASLSRSRCRLDALRPLVSHAVDRGADPVGPHRLRRAGPRARVFSVAFHRAALGASASSLLCRLTLGYRWAAALTPFMTKVVTNNRKLTKAVTQASRRRIARPENVRSHCFGRRCWIMDRRPKPRQLHHESLLSGTTNVIAENECPAHSAPAVGRLLRDPNISTWDLRSDQCYSEAHHYRDRKRQDVAGALACDTWQTPSPYRRWPAN